MSMMAPEILNLAGHGLVLSTRQLGHDAADEIKAALERGSVVISFAGVEVATPSFLDEVLTRLRGVLQSSERAIVLVSGMNEDIEESLALVLEHRKLMLGEIADDHLRLLGGRRQLIETLEKASQLGSFRATELAEELRIKLPSLHQRLKALMDAGVLAREEDDAERGRRHRYSVPDPKELTATTGR